MPQISKEAVAGVWPVNFGEAHITHAFPSIAATALGRLLGSLYSLPQPIGFIIHVLTLPIPVMLAVAMYLISGFRRYEVTSARVRVLRWVKDEGPQVPLSELDDVRLRVRPGQSFYRAADLELISHDELALMLHGVRNPETFRQIILESRDALVRVKECWEAQQQAAAAAS